MYIQYIPVSLVSSCLLQLQFSAIASKIVSHWKYVKHNCHVILKIYLFEKSGYQEIFFARNAGDPELDVLLFKVWRLPPNILHRPTGGCNNGCSAVQGQGSKLDCSPIY